MLSSEFNQEMGSLLRSLEQRIRTEPALSAAQYPGDEALDHLERAIVSLVALYLNVRRRA